MHNLLVTRIGDKKAVFLHGGPLFTEPVTMERYAILPGAPPEKDFRVMVRHWRIEGKKVLLDTLEGDFVGELMIIEEPIPKPRGRGPWVWRDGEWQKK